MIAENSNASSQGLSLDPETRYSALMFDLIAVSPSTAVSFSLTSLLIEMTPGPNMTYLALVSASEGRRAGFATVAGVAIGLAVIGVVAAFGLAEIIQASDFLYNLLRWAGVFFLFYLAWDGWRSQGHAAAARSEAPSRYFVRGLFTNLLNPKAFIFYVAVLPTFIDQRMPLIYQAITLTAIYVGVATFVHAVIVLLAGTLEPLLNDARREKVARRSLSTFLAAVALWFGWSTAR
jgi:threonine/homoserine/homoserine lactone efflux protein